MTLLRDDTITLRALEPTDLDWLYQLENDTDLWLPTNTTAPFSRQLLWQYLEEYDGDIYASRQLRLAVERNADRLALGTVDLFDLDPLNNRAETGIYIAPEHRNAGYGAAALSLICDYARHHLGLTQLYAHIAVANTPCLAVFDRCGFDRIGVLRQWIVRGIERHDAFMLQKVF